MKEYTGKSAIVLLGLMLLLSCLLNLSGKTYAQTSLSERKSYQFINGQWFDGKSFRRQTFFSVNGILTRKKPAKVDELVDLKNGYVVPPFADAHCHHFDSSYNVAQQVGMYLKDGVFYAKVQTDVRSGALQVTDKVNKSTSVDVLYSHGALTSTYGHGVEVYEGLALFYRTGGFTPEQEKKVRASHLRENDAYYIINTADDLEKKWQKILAGKPDFIKIYLLSSEDFEKKKQNLNNIPVGSIGLDPRLVPEIVQKAHAAGLKVSAHIDTVTDYRIALKAGVDEMAHLPGYYIDLDDDPHKYELTEEDVKETAKRGVWVNIAPVAFEFLDSQSPSFKPEVKKRTDAVRVRNLKLLKRYKVKIAFGSDRYGSTPVADVLYLQKLGVFSNLEMLKIWCEDTPRSIFPNRKLGLLKNEYEASFLVFDNNPLMNFEEIKNIRLRFKQGFELKLTK